MRITLLACLDRVQRMHKHVSSETTQTSGQHRLDSARQPVYLRTPHRAPGRVSSHMNVGRALGLQRDFFRLYRSTHGPRNWRRDIELCHRMLIVYQLSFCRIGGGEEVGHSGKYHEGSKGERAAPRVMPVLSFGIGGIATVGEVSRMWQA